MGASTKGANLSWRAPQGPRAQYLPTFGRPYSANKPSTRLFKPFPVYPAPYLSPSPFSRAFFLHFPLTPLPPARSFPLSRAFALVYFPAA
eukprot:2962021-Pleurochrysis_carterae.AAC.1